MGWILGLGNGVVFRQGGGSGSWSSYWTPSSAVVENASPTDIVLTYAKAVNPADAIVGNFSVAGKTISSATLDGTGKILTLVVTVAFVYGDSITVVANGTNISVTNNINAEAELTTYITGLTTQLSSAQLLRLNTLIKSIKTGLSISALSEAFDTLYVLAGETAESSLKNLVKDAHHCTAVNAPTFTQYEGYNGANGKYIDTNFNLATQAVRFTLNSGSYGFYSRTNIEANVSEGGIVYGGNRTFCQIRRKPNEAIGIKNASIIDFNQGSTGNTKNNAITDSRGLFVISRRASNLTDIYRNRDFKVSDNVISSAIPNNTFYILGINQNGEIGLSSSRQISLFFISRLLSPNEIAIVSDTVETYMDALGKGVIS